MGTDDSGLRARLRTFCIQIGSVVIDSVFLALWLVAHWALDVYVIAHFALHGIHAYTLTAFQVLFAVATLFPVLAFVVVDLYAISPTNQALTEEASR